MLRAVEGISKGSKGGNDRTHERCRQALMKPAYLCGTGEAVQDPIARMPSSKIRAI